MREGKTRANGIDFAYLEEGEGPLLLLLHGFPDTAHSWDRQLPAFDGAGYRVIAPFLRGYPPTEVPKEGYYDRATLACDVKELIVALGDGKPAFVVSQDWGAAITYGLLAAYPELVRRAVVMAIPHPQMTRKSVVNSPAQVHRAFHWWFFQLPDLPEIAVSANNFAFIDYLWSQWSPGHEDRAHIEHIKRTLAQPGALSAALGYYRAMLNPARQDPALSDVRAALERPIAVSTLAICGANDIRGEVLEAQSEYFTGPYRWAIVPDCGHFLHREKPDDVNRLVLDWLAMG